MKNFLLSYDALVSIIVALITSFILWINPPTMLVPYWSLVLVIFIAIVFVWLLIKFRIPFDDKIIFSAKVIDFDKNRNKLIFKVNIKNILNYGSIFLIYYKENNYEEKIAIAIVENIQENELIKAYVTKWLVDPQGIDIMRDKIIIKPTSTLYVIEMLNSEE